MMYRMHPPAIVVDKSNAISVRSISRITLPSFRLQTMRLSGPCNDSNEWQWLMECSPFNCPIRNVIQNRISFKFDVNRSRPNWCLWINQWLHFDCHRSTNEWRQARLFRLISQSAHKSDDGWMRNVHLEFRNCTKMGQISPRNLNKFTLRATEGISNRSNNGKQLCPSFERTRSSVGNLRFAILISGAKCAIFNF